MTDYDDLYKPASKATQEEIDYYKDLAWKLQKELNEVRNGYSTEDLKEELRLARLEIKQLKERLGQ